VPVIIEAMAATTALKVGEYRSSIFRWSQHTADLDDEEVVEGRVEFEIAMCGLSIHQPRVNEYAYMYVENERASEYSRVPVIPSPR